MRHEEAAAFAACAYAKFTGRLGVCLATSGPGAIHLLNGLYDAKMDGAPVLAITGQQYSDLLGTQLPAGGEPRSTLFADVAAYNQQVQGADRRLQPGQHRHAAPPSAKRTRRPHHLPH